MKIERNNIFYVSIVCTLVVVLDAAEGIYKYMSTGVFWEPDIYCALAALTCFGCCAWEHFENRFNELETHIGELEQ